MDKQRAILVNPRQDKMIRANLPSYIDQSRGAIPPLGLMSVATYANLFTDWDVKVIDLMVEDRYWLRSFVDVWSPKIVGITATTFTLLDALDVARAVKDVDSRVVVVLGGVHASIYPDESLDLPNIDYVIAGEGEELFTDFIRRYESGDDIPGITKAEGYIEDLDSIPYPDRDLVDYRKYSSRWGKGGYMTTILTSRGCPYGCIFCHRPHLGKRFRARSAEDVVEELEMIARKGIKEVIFYDDTFGVDRDRMIAICRGMIDAKLGLTFDIRTRVNDVDNDTLLYLSAAGCKQINYGIEASSDKILEKLNKGITLEDVERSVYWTKRYGIGVLAYFILGNPGETLVDLEQTIRYAKKLKPDYCHFAVMTPYPATELYQEYLNQGGEDYWREYARNPREDFMPQYWGEIPRELLEHYLNKAYKDFYMRPSFMLKQLAKTRSIKLLAKRAKTGLRILGG